MMPDCNHAMHRGGRQRHSARALHRGLSQPLLVAYIVAGPAVFGWVGAHDQIDLLAQIGITVLLFVVGLELDLHHIRHIGPVALATGLGQLSFTILFGSPALAGCGMLSLFYTLKVKRRRPHDASRCRPPTVHTRTSPF